MSRGRLSGSVKYLFGDSSSSTFAFPSTTTPVHCPIAVLTPSTKQTFIKKGLQSRADLGASTWPLCNSIFADSAVKSGHSEHQLDDYSLPLR
jgi:hypothetical protein